MSQIDMYRFTNHKLLTFQSSRFFCLFYLKNFDPGEASLALGRAGFTFFAAHPGIPRVLNQLLKLSPGDY